MPSDVHIAIAETEDEKRAVYRFRYSIYVEEMGKYKSVADHERRMFSEPCDAHSRIFYATENGDLLEDILTAGRYHAVVCLGAVVRHETAHFEYVAGQAAEGIQRAALDTGVPCIFGVLTCDSEEQALERAGGKHGNKGFEAVEAAVRVANLLRDLPAD